MKKYVLDTKKMREKQEYPSIERLKNGPVAVAECIEQIPCNPCESSCKYGAIKIGTPITNCPQIEYDICVGCGNCIAKCPGLAIFVLNMSYSENNGSVSFPFEYQHTPKKGDRVRALDRNGCYVSDGTVKKVVCPENYDRTPVVTIEVPIEFVEVVRGIEVVLE